MVKQTFSLLKDLDFQHNPPLLEECSEELFLLPLEIQFLKEFPFYFLRLLMKKYLDLWWGLNIIVIVIIYQLSVLLYLLLIYLKDFTIVKLKCSQIVVSIILLLSNQYFNNMDIKFFIREQKLGLDFY